MIKVEDLTIFYDKTNNEIIKNVSFDIVPQKIVLLYGKSGSGKTSTMRAVAREIENYKGKITLDGISIQKIPLCKYFKSAFQFTKSNILIYIQTLNLMKSTKTASANRLITIYSTRCKNPDRRFLLLHCSNLNW